MVLRIFRADLSAQSEEQNEVERWHVILRIYVPFTAVVGLVAHVFYEGHPSTGWRI